MYYKIYTYISRISKKISFKITLLSEDIAKCPLFEYNLNKGLTPYGSLPIIIFFCSISSKQNANTPSKDLATLSDPPWAYKCKITSTSHLVVY